MLEELLALMGNDGEKIGGSGCFGTTIVHGLTHYPTQLEWVRSRENQQSSDKNKMLGFTRFNPTYTIRDRSVGDFGVILAPSKSRLAPAEQI